LAREWTRKVGSCLEVVIIYGSADCPLEVLHSAEEALWLDVR